MRIRVMPGFGRTLLLPSGAFAAALAAVVGFVLVADRRLAISGAAAAVFGLFELGRAVRTIAASRRRADAWLRTSTGRVIPSAYAWRAEQLLSSRHRRMLAHSLRAIVRSGHERALANYAPRLIAARHLQTSLETLAGALERESEPVTPAGVLRVAELVSDSTGPLWGTSEEALAGEIRTTLRLLRA